MRSHACLKWDRDPRGWRTLRDDGRHQRCSRACPPQGAGMFFIASATKIADGEGDVQRAKLKDDARKWMAAKLRPEEVRRPRHTVRALGIGKPIETLLADNSPSHTPEAS